MIIWLEKNSKLSWAITIIISIIIFYISSLTFESTPSGGFGINTILYHILAFFFLSLFLSISIIKGKNKALIFLAANIAIIYAFSDEIHQLFVPGRNSSLLDVLFDSIGILLASMLYIISIEYRKRKKFNFS